MKLEKRLAAALLCAAMVLTALTACSGTPVEKLEWETSKTKQYFDAKGVTAQELTLTADIAASGQKVHVNYAVKGKQAGFEFDAGGSNIRKLRVDTEGNLYENSYDRWYQYPASSEQAKVQADAVRAGMGYFAVPDAESVGSITAGEYKMDGKTYEMETIKLHQNGVYATYSYSYCYDGNDLSFILLESVGGMMNNIELKAVADQNIIAIPQDYNTME